MIAPMSKIQNKDLIEQLQWRYAVKKFDSSKKIPDSDWKTLEQSLVLTPSSYGLQPWNFLVVQNPELRKELRTHSWNQSQVEEASHFVVFTIMDEVDEAHVDRFIERIAYLRKAPVEDFSGLKKMLMNNVVSGPSAQQKREWAARQAYIALGNFMTAAALLGIDTCPMEGLDPLKYDKTLKLAGTGYSTVVACAAGYRSAEDKYASIPKVRFLPADVLKYI